MKALVLNVWAWILAHPEQVMGAVFALLSAILAATIANARAKGAPVGWFARFVDRLAARTRANAANAGWSWPIVGRSIFEAAVDASAPPSDPPPASPGFSDAAVMRFVAAVSLVALAAATCCGCGAATPHLQAIPPSIVERSGYGTCAETGGKIEVAAGTVSLLTSVCWRPMDAGAADASAPPAIESGDELVVDKADAGEVDQ